MNSAICVYEVAQLSYFQGKRGILEWLLHFTSAEHSQISTFKALDERPKASEITIISRSTVRMDFCQLRKLGKILGSSLVRR